MLHLFLILSRHGFFFFFFCILVIRTIFTRCGPEVWPWLRRNGSVNVFGDDGCLMYLEKFNANGELTTCRQLKYQSPTCFHATFLNERYLVGSNTFVLSILFNQMYLTPFTTISVTTGRFLCILLLVVSWRV